MVFLSSPYLSVLSAGTASIICMSPGADPAIRPLGCERVKENPSEHLYFKGDGGRELQSTPA
jgi:hypothetical protein